MKRSIYTLCLLLLACTWTMQAQTVYRGQVSVAKTAAKLQDNQLTLTMDISLCGLSVGRHQSLSISPMLRNGRDSLLLQPILLNGANKQKMYQRALTLQGKRSADGGAYLVAKNDPLVILQVPYEKTVTYHPWMKQAELVLVGRLMNYNDTPLQVFVNVLTDRLPVSLQK